MIDDMDFIVRDKHFVEVSEVRPDTKKRITLGRVSQNATSYRVYENELGQIILDPQVSIPASEAWLFKNKKALRSVMRGLAQARAGTIVPAPEDYSKYLDPEDR